MNEYSMATFFAYPRRHHATVLSYRRYHSHRIRCSECALELYSGVVLECRLSSQRCSLAFALSLVCEQLGFLFGGHPPNRNHSCHAVWETQLKKDQRKCLQEVGTEGAP